MKYPVFIAVFAAIACIGLPGCNLRNDVRQTIIPKVRLTSPVGDQAQATRSFSATIREAAEVNLAFRVAGPIQEVYVEEGDRVGQGDLIARIDPRDYEIQLAVYEAQYTQVKAEYDRLTELNARQSISDNDYEKAVAGEKMLRTQLQHARDQLNDVRLTAPFSGTIQSVKYNRGEMVNAGMPVATLLDMRHFLVEVDLPVSVIIRQQDFLGFWCEQPRISDMRYPIVFAGYQTKAGNNQMYRTTFRLDPALNQQLKPGMHVSVIIEYSHGENTPVHIPLSALFSEHGKSYVWLYRKKTSSVYRQEVMTGTLAGSGRIFIHEGLSVSDTIVAAGIRGLREGITVEPMQPASQTNVGGLM